MLQGCSIYGVLRNFVGPLSLALAFVVVLAGCIDPLTAPRLKPPTPVPKTLPAAAQTWVVETFEAPQSTLGGFWCAFDHNGLGTKVSADAFVLVGAAASVLEFHESAGSIAAPSQRPFLGEGGRLSLRGRARDATVTDEDHLKQQFVANSDWTQIALPLSRASG